MVYVERGAEEEELNAWAYEIICIVICLASAFHLPVHVKLSQERTSRLILIGKSYLIKAIDRTSYESEYW